MKRVSNQLGENPQFTQGVFAATFLLGVAGVLAMKIEGVAQLWVTAWPIALMFLYASLVFIPPIRLRPDQTGDNIYYLGFLFTLVSLGYSLYQFSQSTGADEIVNNFGIAISSTIFGVFGRVMLNQMRTDPWEVERVTRLALADSARNLRSELDNSVIEFNAFRRQTQQAAADGLRELRELASRELRQSNNQFEDLLEQMVTRVDRAVGQWVVMAEQFNARSVEMAKAMERLGERLEAVETPANIITGKLEPASAAVGQLAVAAGEASTHIQGTLGRVEASAGELKGLVEASREIIETTRAQAAALTEALSVLQAAQRQVEELKSAASKFDVGISQKADDLNTGLGRIADRLNAHLEAARDLTDRSRSDWNAEVASSIAQLTTQIEKLVAVQLEPTVPENPLQGIGIAPETAL